jgi:hypothetical protein
MACGSCGGAAARAIQKRAIGEQAKAKPVSKPTQIPKIRPTSTTRIVIAAPNTAIKIKQQLKDLKKCPLCGSALSPIISGSGARNRKKCTRCNRTFT